MSRHHESKQQSSGGMSVVMISKALVTGAYHRKLDELARLGVELSLIVPPSWGNLSLEVREANGYRIYPSKIFFSGRNHFHFYANLLPLLQKIKPEIVHIDEEHYSVVTFQAMRAAKAVSAKTVFFTWQNIYKAYPFPFSLMERYAFNKSAAAMAGNNEAVGVLREKGYAKEIHVIPQFGIDPEMFQVRECRGLRERIGLRSQDFVIGFMGRLVEEKGLGTLLDALSNLPMHTRLLLIGSGPDKDKLKETAHRLSLASRVSIIDQVPSLEVPGYMNCMDCLVLPSLTRPNWKEQFGRVLIEAMACEVPVVGSSSGEIPNVIGDAGLVFPEGKSGDLFKRLELLIKDRGLRTELGKQGRRRVLANFTQRKIAEATYEVYQRIR